MVSTFDSESEEIKHSAVNACLAPVVSSITFLPHEHKQSNIPHPAPKDAVR